MKTVVFRTDASLQIGTGHVMRCLTLANALKAKDITCIFICREHCGNLIDFIRDSGFVVNALPIGAQTTDGSYADWLGVPWEEDAAQTLAVMRDLKVERLIVDHYALDAKWEAMMRPHCAAVNYTLMRLIISARIAPKQTSLCRCSYMSPALPKGFRMWDNS